MDTPFGTQFTHLTRNPISSGAIKIRSEQKCSLDNTFVGNGGVLT